MPAIRFPNVPPKVTAYVKIGVDVVTNIVLALIDEFTDIISGVRYLM